MDVAELGRVGRAYLVAVRERVGEDLVAGRQLEEPRVQSDVAAVARRKVSAGDPTGTGRPTRSAPWARAVATTQACSAEPIPRPVWSGWTAATARAPCTWARATSTPSETTPRLWVARSTLGRAQSLTTSASSVIGSEIDSASTATMTSTTARASSWVSGRDR